MDSLRQGPELNLVVVPESDNHVAPQSNPSAHRLHILNLLVGCIQALSCNTHSA